jgi:hypothetical protein
MEISEDRIERIAGEVLRDLMREAGAGRASSAGGGLPGVFSDMESAVAAAREAQKALVSGSLVTRRAVISAMRRAILDNL